MGSSNSTTSSKWGATISKWGTAACRTAGCMRKGCHHTTTGCHHTAWDRMVRRRTMGCRPTIIGCTDIMGCSTTTTARVGRPAGMRARWDGTRGGRWHGTILPWLGGAAMGGISRWGGLRWGDHTGGPQWVGRGVDLSGAGRSSTGAGRSSTGAAAAAASGSSGSVHWHTTAASPSLVSSWAAYPPK